MCPEIEIGINFDEAEKLSGPIPADDYDVQCTGAEVGETGPNSKNPGTPKIDWEFSVINSSNPAFNGRRLFMSTIIPHGDMKGLNFIVAATKAMGKKWSGSRLNTEDYIGSLCKAKVIQEEYNGAVNNKIAKLF